MARSAGLLGTPSDPFGSGSAYSGGWGSLDPSRPAYLAFQKVQTAYQLGQATADEYLAAFKTYVDATPANTTTRYNAEQSYASAVYGIGRDKIAFAVEQGKQPISDLVAYDRAGTEGLDESTALYQSRMSALWQSESRQFSEAEDEISAGVSKGTMTWTQALAWYQEQRNQYADNPDLAKALDGRITQAEDRAASEVDNQITQDFNDGKVGIGQYLTYGATVIAANPGTTRAENWTTNLVKAKEQAVGASLNYRYGLTQEYAKLEQFVRQGPPSSGGGGSRSTQLVSDGNGGWKEVAKSSGSSSSGSSTAAWNLQATQAKARMEAIKRMVEGLPGGWVTADDMIANAQQQQAGLVKGSGEWLQLQARIDNWNQDKATLDLLSKSGMKIVYPGVGSESTVDDTVGATERPVGAGTWSGYSGRSSGGGSGGGGGGGSAGSGLALTPNSSGNGPLMRATGTLPGASNTFGGSNGREFRDVTPTYQTTGIPKGMTAASWDRLYDAFIKAIKSGDTSYVDPTSGVTYLIPADPDKRLAMLSAMDASNLSLKAAAMKQRSGTASEVTAAADYTKALNDSRSNTLYVIDQHPTSGVTFESRPVEVDAVTMGRAPQTTRKTITDITDPTEKALAAAEGKVPTNWLGAAIDLIDTTQTKFDTLKEQADKAIARGDYSMAYIYLRQAGEVVSDPRLLAAMDQYSALGQAYLQSGTVPNDATIQGDLKRLTDTITTDGHGSAKWLSDLSKTIEPTAALFDPNDPNCIVKTTGSGSGASIYSDPVTGAPSLKDGVFAVYEPPTAGSNNDGSVKFVHTESSGVTFNGNGSSKSTTSMPGYVAVNAQVGGSWQQLQVKSSNETVGTFVDPSTGMQSTLTGRKIVTKLDGVSTTLVEDPFHAGSWIPVQQGESAPVYKFPPGTVPLTQKIPGLDASQPQFLVMSKLPGETIPTAFVAGYDKESGQYALYQRDQNGGFTVRLSPGQAASVFDASGIGVDTSKLTDLQKTYWFLGTMLPPDPTTGVKSNAFMGSPDDIAKKTLGVAGAKTVQFLTKLKDMFFPSAPPPSVTAPKARDSWWNEPTPAAPPVPAKPTSALQPGQTIGGPTSPVQQQTTIAPPSWMNNPTIGPVTPSAPTSAVQPGQTMGPIAPAPGTSPSSSTPPVRPPAQKVNKQGSIQATNTSRGMD